MKTVVTVSTKGQIVIPQEARERLGIKPGTKLKIRLAENHLELSRLPKDLIGYLCGVVRRGPSLSRVWLEEREADRDREEKKATRFARGAHVSAKRKRV
ncbi:AbrB/MazE/SpoVT family DNA-binding domain-containing protein [Acidobacteriia bacterium AH_259_A11_L15]|nr:AbrB/MazE/SpoVT family DNA-binding domain-containing protein [Acidobacteriia bacterium AH_259_A11_L15]